MTEPLEGPSRRSNPHRVAEIVIGGAAALLIVGGLMAPAIGQSEPEPRPDAATRDVSGDSATAPASTGFGSQATDGDTLTTADGNTVTLASKPTVLFFMTSEACGACMEEAAVLDELAPRWGDDVNVIGVEMVPGTPDSSLQAFSESLGGLSFPLAVDDGELVSRFSVQTLDTTVVLDAQGREVWRDTVVSDEATLNAAVTQAGRRA